MTYQEQLNDVRWWVRRNEILERDDFCCQDCLRGPSKLSTYIQLQVHHIKYFDGLMAWEYADEFLITLCKDCHEKMHGLIPDMRDERQKPVFVYGIRNLKSQPVRHISDVIRDMIKSMENG